MTALVRKLEEFPPGSLIPRDWVLAQLRSEEVVRENRRYMIGGRDAAQLLGMEPRKLRRMAARWEQKYLRGMEVEVRVERKNPNSERSDYLYDHNDVLAYQAARPKLAVVNGGVPRGRPPKNAPDPGPASDDEIEAIADDYIRRNHA